MILPNPALLIPGSGPLGCWDFSHPELCTCGILGSALCCSLPCLLSLAGWSHLFQLIRWDEHHQRHCGGAAGPGEIKNDYGDFHPLKPVDALCITAQIHPELSLGYPLISSQTHH